MGLSIIHQELNLMTHLTVAQNIFIGREANQKYKFLLDDKRINHKLRIIDTLHLKLIPRAKVADLTVAKQQMVDNAKALS
jgi:ribose transport system ATP-binding protein